MKPLALDVRGPVGEDAERKADRARMQVLFDEGKYKEVIVYVDECFGWGEGELEAEYGKPREYTKEVAQKCIDTL